MILFYGSTSFPQHCMSNVVQLRHCRIAKEQSRILGSTFFFNLPLCLLNFRLRLESLSLTLRSVGKRKKKPSFGCLGASKASGFCCYCCDCYWLLCCHLCGCMAFGGYVKFPLSFSIVLF